MTAIVDSVPLLLHLLLVSPFSSKFLRLQVSKVQGGDEEVVSGQGERARTGTLTRDRHWPTSVLIVLS